MPRRGARWLNSTVLGIGLASLFSDWSHEIATAAMPAFLATLGVSGDGLEQSKACRTDFLRSRKWRPASIRTSWPAGSQSLLPVMSARQSQQHLSPLPIKPGTCCWHGPLAGSAADSAHRCEKHCSPLPSLRKPTAAHLGLNVLWTRLEPLSVH